jgi:hypothetical protein
MRGENPPYMNPHFLTVEYKRALEALILKKFCSMSGYELGLTSCDVVTYPRHKYPEVLVIETKVEIFTISKKYRLIFDNTAVHRCKIEIKNPFQGISSISDQVLLALAFNHGNS